MGSPQQAALLEVLKEIMEGCGWLVGGGGGRPESSHGSLENGTSDRYDTKLLLSSVILEILL